MSYRHTAGKQYLFIADDLKGMKVMLFRSCTDGQYLVAAEDGEVFSAQHSELFGPLSEDIVTEVDMEGMSLEERINALSCHTPEITPLSWVMATLTYGVERELNFGECYRVVEQRGDVVCLDGYPNLYSAKRFRPLVNHADLNKGN